MTPANRALQRGSLPKLPEFPLARLQPEPAYFLPQEGRRTACFVFDLKDVQDIAGIVEPFFSTVKAAVSVCPVMNADDLRAGLRQAMSKTA